MAHVYSPGDVVVSVNTLPITARADGEFFSVEMNADKSTLKMGADGEGGVTISKDDSGKITITVQQGSEANDILMAVYNLWVTAKTPCAIFAKDLNGRSLHVAEVAWPVKLPKAAYGKEQQDVAWIFESDRIANNIGGSNILST